LVVSTKELSPISPLPLSIFDKYKDRLREYPIKIKIAPTKAMEYCRQVSGIPKKGKTVKKIPNKKTKLSLDIKIILLLYCVFEKE